MKKYAIPFVLVLLIASIAWAALWSDYSELTAGSIASTDDMLVRDVSDTSQGPGGTLKRYTWTSINTRIAAAATDDPGVLYRLVRQSTNIRCRVAMLPPRPTRTQVEASQSRLRIQV